MPVKGFVQTLVVENVMIFLPDTSWRVFSKSPIRTRLPWVLTISQLTNTLVLISTFKLGTVVVVGEVGAGVVGGQGGPEHSAISSGSPGH